MGAGESGSLRWATVSTVVVVLAGFVTALAVGWTTDDDRARTPEAVLDPFATSTTATTLPPSTTTTLPAEPIDVEELPGPYTRVVATNDGIVLATPDGSLPYRRLTREPVWLAFGAGEGRVVYQGFGEEDVGSGPIVVRDALAEHEVFGLGPSHGTEAHALWDAGFVGGRPYALVATTVGRRPEDLELHLVLVDLVTYRQLDLGRVGGWEEWVAGARLLPNGDVVVLTGQLVGHTVERRRLDGTTAWSRPLEGDPSRTLALHRLSPDPDALIVLVLEPTHRADDDHPSLAVTELALETGEPLGGAIRHRVLFVDEDLEVPATFCTYAEAVEGFLLCDGGLGPALRIGLADGTARAEPGAPPGRTMTTWRFPP